MKCLLESHKTRLVRDYPLKCCGRYFGAASNCRTPSLRIGLRETTVRGFTRHDSHQASAAREQCHLAKMRASPELLHDDAILDGGCRSLQHEEHSRVVTVAFIENRVADFKVDLCGVLEVRQLELRSDITTKQKKIQIHMKWAISESSTGHFYAVQQCVERYFRVSRVFQQRSLHEQTLIRGEVACWSDEQLDSNDCCGVGSLISSNRYFTFGFQIV